MIYTHVFYISLGVYVYDVSQINWQHEIKRQRWQKLMVLVVKGRMYKNAFRTFLSVDHDVVLSIPFLLSFYQYFQFLFVRACAIASCQPARTHCALTPVISRVSVEFLLEHQRSSTSAIMSVAGATRSLLLLGRCVPSVKQNASKIVVKKLELDQNLLMVIQSYFFISKYFFTLHAHILCGFLFQYFNKDEVYYAHDPKRLCKTGDVVLIQELPEKLTTYITHNVLRVVYPLGDVTDPITNKKVAALRCGTVCYRFVTLVVYSYFDFLH